MGPDCLLGVVPQPTDSRLSETIYDVVIKQSSHTTYYSFTFKSNRSPQLPPVLNAAPGVGHVGKPVLQPLREDPLRHDGHIGRAVPQRVGHGQYDEQLQHTDQHT